MQVWVYHADAFIGHRCEQNTFPTGRAPVFTTGPLRALQTETFSDENGFEIQRRIRGHRLLKISQTPIQILLP